MKSKALLIMMLAGGSLFAETHAAASNPPGADFSSQQQGFSIHGEGPSGQ
jgi:hypothetical protein